MAVTQTHNDKRRAPVIDTAQSVCASTILEDITGMLAYIFPAVFLMKLESIFPERLLLYFCPDELLNTAEIIRAAFDNGHECYRQIITLRKLSALF